MPLALRGACAGCKLQCPPQLPNCTPKLRPALQLVDTADKFFDTHPKYTRVQLVDGRVPKGEWAKDAAPRVTAKLAEMGKEREGAIESGRFDIFSVKVSSKRRGRALQAVRRGWRCAGASCFRCTALTHHSADQGTASSCTHPSLATAE